MARYSEHDTTQIYAAADRFRDACLRRDGSLIFDDASVWTKDNLATLHRVFVMAPEAGDRSFVDKFRDQVSPAGQAVTRLAAEALCLYFLFPSNVGGSRKRELVNEVLAWGGDSLSPDHALSAAFGRGIGSGGQGYNTRRPFEIGFLLEFAIAWKGLTDGERSEALADPWGFQARVDAVDGAATRQLRHMLLHLLFPDDFERIASGSHKRRVVGAFAGLVKTPPDDDDRHLFEIRRELEQILPGRKLDFYWAPLEAAWYDTTEASADFAPLDVIRYKRQLVLFGPPGTGKTYRAKRLAERIIRSTALRGMGAARYFREQTTVDAAITANVHRLQLHPAYSYEDFIRGLHITESGATEYRPGYLPELVREMEESKAEPRLPHVLILDELNRTDLTRMLGECFSLLEDRNQTIDLPARDKQGKPMTLRLPEDLFVIGTMNLIDQSIEQVDFALRRRFLWIPCPFDAEALLAASESLWKSQDVGLGWDRVEGDFRRLAAAATTLNREIRSSAFLGGQYEIGHTYLLDVVSFLRDELGRKPRPRGGYLWRKKEALRPIAQVWRLSLRPLLHEYLSGLETVARGRARATRRCVPGSGGVGVTLGARDCSPFDVQPRGEEVEWLKRLAVATRDGRNVASLGPERDDDEPIVWCAPDGAWWAGRYVGSVLFEGRRLTIRPRFGLAALRNWLFQATNVALVDSPGVLRDDDSFVVQLLAAVWARGFVEAARHGLPALRREVRFSGPVVRGRLDVRGSLRLIAGGAATVSSVRGERSLDHAASRAIVAAYVVLRRWIGRGDDQWLSPRARELLPGLMAVTGSRPRVPSRVELKQIRYTPITIGFAPVAELSRQIANSHGLSADTAPSGECQGVLLDVAELWELYVLAVLRRAAVGLAVRHGTRELGPAGALLRSERDGALLGNLRPDALVADGGRVIGILDAKYKQLHPTTLSPTGPQRADLYQMAAYLARFGSDPTVWGVLAYPFDPARPEQPAAELRSPWVLDRRARTSFVTLPHEVESAASKLRSVIERATPQGLPTPARQQASARR